MAAFAFLDYRAAIVLETAVHRKEKADARPRWGLPEIRRCGNLPVI
jgi:hypothetical protein